jgi:hypothetical protein
MLGILLQVSGANSTRPTSAPVAGVAGGGGAKTLMGKTNAGPAGFGKKSAAGGLSRFSSRARVASADLRFSLRALAVSAGLVRELELAGSAPPVTSAGLVREL